MRRVIVLTTLSFLLCSDLLGQVITNFEMYAEFPQQQVITRRDTQLTKVPYYGFGFNLYAGGNKLGLDFETNVRSYDLLSYYDPNYGNAGIWDLYIGLKYYSSTPRLPSGFTIGSSIAVRFTFGCLFGITSFLWNKNAQSTSYTGSAPTVSTFASSYYVGVILSPFYSTTGISIKYVYRPYRFTFDPFTVNDIYAIQIGILFGPSTQ